MQRQKQKKEGTLLCLLLLTGFFLLLELSFFIQSNKTYLFDYTFVSNNLSIPVTIIPGILYFIFAQLLIHLMFCFIIWVVVEWIADLFQLSSSRKIPFAILIWFLGLMMVLVLNQYFYPNSKFSNLSVLILFNQEITKLALLFFLTCSFLVLLLACIRFVKIIRKQFIFYNIFIVGFLILSFIFTKYTTIHPVDAATKERPNIILIGVDSLRPDFLSYFGYDRSTPFFDSFLEQARVFSESVTPLARTFPSWSGILTGQYPNQMNVRSNLAPQSNLHLQNTLPAILQRHGYKTIYATDETRFSNMGKNFGFDQIISPPTGLNDFLIGTFNDFPISNLLINTMVGKWLFPYSYANRPVYFVYQPDSFLKLLALNLKVERKKPLFLAVHFCLTHYPYLWANFSGKELTPQERYVESIVEVDKQINRFFTLLKQRHLLDHAIVVLLSDHGEALELPGDRITEKDLFMPSQYVNAAAPRFYPSGNAEEAVNQSVGHGTDVLGLPQYHTVLAFRIYGEEVFRPGVTSGIVTLLDIKPTLLNLIHLPAPESNGISLSAVIQDEVSLPLSVRPIFLESDFSPEAIRTVYPEERKVLLEGIDLFEINPRTMRLTVKDSMTTKIINSKQRAVIYGSWMLALYPQNKNIHIPILINLDNGEWTNNLKSLFASHAPVQLMLDELKAFYGSEMHHINIQPYV
ncbi:MAG: sulfatase-like hydrolase/transferase [Gammaproteobacteria bacterium]|nr:sulfatase-like hydrolase/transferase [Gammaproteobacteria bacterium]MCW5583202.1 sulfatase-like hydrolase/transferase [Gammaproteobacteria bacterium]